MFWSLNIENWNLFVMWCLLFGFLLISFKYNIQDTKVTCAKVDENYPRTTPGGMGCPRRKSVIVSRFPDAP